MKEKEIDIYIYVCMYIHNIECNEYECLNEYEKAEEEKDETRVKRGRET